MKTTTPQSTPSSIEDEMLPEESKSPSHSGSEKDDPQSSSSEHEVLEPKGQETKAKSIQQTEHLKEAVR